MASLDFQNVSSGPSFLNLGSPETPKVLLNFFACPGGIICPAATENDEGVMYGIAH